VRLSAAYWPRRLFVSFQCWFFFQAEDGIRVFHVTGVQTCALPISLPCGRGQLRQPSKARLGEGYPALHTAPAERGPSSGSLWLPDRKSTPSELQSREKPRMPSSA